jgi:signal transduction histidine kinase
VTSTRSRLLRLSSHAVRGGVHLVLGGIIAAGYVVLGAGLVQLARSAPAVPLGLTAVLTAIAVPLALVPPLLAPVRDVNVAAARSLLDVDLAGPTAELTWDDRLRSAGFFVAHLIVGAFAVVALLSGIPFAVGLVGWAAGARGDGFQISAPAIGLWGVPLAVLILLALPVLAVLGRALMRALAMPLLGPSASAREQAERHERLVLAERNRIARELHDGVGHALAITTMQASVAEASLGRDDAAARAALAEIARVGRSAMADLDRSLAVLREEKRDTAPPAPQPTLADLPGLRSSAHLAGHELRLSGDPGDLTGLDDLLSRECYQVIAEAVVNAQRHGSGPIDLSWHRGEGTVTLEVSNAVGPAGPAAAGGGRGLIGMRERAALVGATLEAGADGDRWRVVLTVSGVER